MGKVFDCLLSTEMEGTIKINTSHFKSKDDRWSLRVPVVIWVRQNILKTRFIEADVTGTLHYGSRNP